MNSMTERHSEAASTCTGMALVDASRSMRMFVALPSSSFSSSCALTSQVASTANDTMQQQRQQRRVMATMPKLSEFKLSNNWDKCVEDLLVRGGVGLAVGGILSLAVFRK